MIYSTKKSGRPMGSKTSSLAIERAEKLKEAIVQEHPPLIPGDLWRVRLGDSAMLSRDRVLRIVSTTPSTVKFAEVPASSFEPEYSLNKVTFIEKIILD